MQKDRIHTNVIPPELWAREDFFNVCLIVFVNASIKRLSSALASHGFSQS